MKIDIIMINLIMSFTAIVVSIVSLYRSFATDKFNKKMSKSVLEKELLNRINNARTSYSMLYEKIMDMEKTDIQKQLSELAVKERLEEYINALEYTCDKYLDGVLDKKSFKRNFSSLVTGLFDQNNVYEVMDSEEKNKYPALKHVYNELSQEK